MPSPVRPDPSGDNRIGELNQKSLHQAIKHYLAGDDGQVEVRLGRYHIDVVREGVLYEIQTRHVYAIRKKLLALSQEHLVVLVLPVEIERWIVRLDREGRQISRRKSPRRGRVEDVFHELARAADLINEPNLSVLALLIRSEHVWQDSGAGSWRRKGWEVVDRRLVEITGSLRIATVEDLLGFLPRELPEEFTNKDLAGWMNCSHRLASGITYTLRQLGRLEVVRRSKAGFVLRVRR